jgi:hypothetical protein
MKKEKYPTGILKEVSERTNTPYTTVLMYAHGKGKDIIKQALVLEEIQNLMQYYTDRKKQAQEKIKELLQEKIK